MNILLFGLIAEKAGTSSLDISAPDTGSLKEALEERIVGLSSLSYAIAVDRKITHGNMELKGSEEIALLPPFAGG